MRGVNVVQLSLQYACAGAFAFLTFQLIRSRSAWIVPFFTALCAVSALHGLTWTRHGHTQFFLVEPLLLSLKFCSSVEAFLFVARRVPSQEGRAIAGLLACIGSIGVFITLGVFDRSTLMGLYKSIRLNAHSFMALASVFGMLVMMIKPIRFSPSERNHAIILTVYLLKFVTVEMFRGTATDEGPGYSWLLAISMAWSLACCAAWMKWGVSARPNTRPASLQSV